MKKLLALFLLGLGIALTFPMLNRSSGAIVAQISPTGNGITAAISQGDRILRVNQNYQVSGMTTEELVAQMSANGWQDPVSGKRHFAGTKWQLEIDLVTEQQGAICTARKSNITTTIAKTMPVWANPSGGKLLADWQTFHNALDQHEEGHALNVETAHKELRMMLNVATAPDCATLAQLVHQNRVDIARRYALMDAAYDQQTGHGSTQGAVFPPA